MMDMMFSKNVMLKHPASHFSSAFWRPEDILKSFISSKYIYVICFPKMTATSNPISSGLPEIPLSVFPP
jgi:hypothetical protein